MVWISSTNGGRNEFIQGFGRESLRERQLLSLKTKREDNIKMDFKERILEELAQDDV
jgi:hypothetical protein